MGKKMKVVIFGAGISGLSLAWFLKKKFKSSIDLTIIEKDSYSGGYIKSLKKAGFLFELGPRSCRTAGNGVKTLQLIEDLNLTKEVVVASPFAKKRYVYLDQRMEQAPGSFFSLFKSPLTKGLFKALIFDLFGKYKSSDDDPSIHEYASKKFSPEIADNLFDPLTSGIYAGNISKLSFKSCFPYLHELENAHGSLIWGMFLNKKKINEIFSPFVKNLKKHKIFSLKNGMQTLTDVLSKELKGHILFSAEIENLRILNDSTKIFLKNKEVIHADYVFSSLSPHDLKTLLPEGKMKEILTEFHSTSVAVVSLGFKKDVLKTKGFGYLIPSKEKEDILGVVFDSSVFNQQNRKADETRLTVMLGGSHMRDFERKTEDDFLKMSKNALVKHLGIKDVPDVSHVYIAKNAIPQYLVGHGERLQKLKKACPEHFQVLGSCYFGVSVNDCIANSEHSANEFFKSLYDSQSLHPF